jgi:hypothetical protein
MQGKCLHIGLVSHPSCAPRTTSDQRIPMS